MERIDIQKNVRRVDYFELSKEQGSLSSDTLREKVEKARAIQQERFANDLQVNCNAQMTTSMIQKYCKLDEESTAILKEASEKHGYSARVIHKLLRLARTAADLRGAVTISREDIIFVLGCRDLDKSNSDMYVIQQMKIVNYMFLEGKMELYYVWLECIKGFGPVAWHDFLWEYGDPEMIYRNRHELLPKGRISGSQIEILKERADDAFENATVILKKCQHYPSAGL